jgi:hypothetical protein
MKYNGQTGWKFNIRCKQHVHMVRKSNSNSGYCNHIPSIGHKYSIITDTMDVIRTRRKGKHLNTLEKYYIHKISRDNLHMEDI